MEEKKFNLILGDCLVEMETLIDNGIKVDMILCDLPYGTTACSWDVVIPFEQLWSCYNRIIKENGAIVLTASQPFTSALVMSNPKMFKYEWIWIKNRGSNFATVKYMPMKEHENILVFGKGTLKYNPQMQKRTGGGADRVNYKINPSTSAEVYNGLVAKESTMRGELREPSSWQKFNTEVGKHPTQKPVYLMQYLIQTYTDKNETVLDNTMGSGTCGVACMKIGRNFIGIEKEQKYFDIAQERISAEGNQIKLF